MRTNPSSDKNWLTRESERWAADGVITPEQRAAILGRYPDDASSTLFGSATLSWLAWLVGACGVILLVAWNWDGLSHSAKVGGTLVVTLAAYAAAAWLWQRGAPGRAELLAFAGALLAGAFVAAITEMWKVQQTWPMLAWAVVIAVTALVAASPVTTTLGAGVLLFWVLVDSGSPPASWAFLAVFPLLAVALERRSHWLAAGATSLALGGWVTLTAMELWQGPSAVPAVFAIAVGAAIDAWAHRPDGRRPAFARATPGLVFMIGGFALMTAGALARSSPGAWFAYASTTTPALVLLGTLVAVSVWPATTRSGEAGTSAPPYRRPQAAGAIVAIWLALWFVLPPQAGPAPEWWAWLWLVVSSAGLVGITISAVAESVATRDRGVLFAGIGAMLVLILVHITAAGPGRFGRSALVLFVSAAALWWTTSRHKSSPVRPQL